MLLGSQFQIQLILLLVSGLQVSCADTPVMLSNKNTGRTLGISFHLPHFYFYFLVIVSFNNGITINLLFIFYFSLDFG